MAVTIKELRENTGLTQKAFAAKFGIPVSTLRKWEQGESRPAPYIMNMISMLLPMPEKYSEIIQTASGDRYFYDKSANSISDSLGNTIQIGVSLEGVKRENLRLYVKDMFDSFYDVRGRFEQDCEYDKNEDIIWS
ncbi:MULTISPECIES: helix-turn-helix domain-containing protein [unclassified Butyrivibrio]|uniref:helix-turn-helix domain-containing protein n=1 Tax=unclassified Butyrivibrio TaxID=2639466 RepID=UPI0004114635|nr:MULTISPECIES: helix-turn-helix domain-containing protein [unclassified Butyrivibrio]